MLERACETVVERRYQVVVSAKDIPGTQKPRIVKLHGSFPSQRPFVITEEDYRTYPRRFAPFVNMVQQSIMENAFCLLGFSEDDPNFLEWTGWVHDNLGDAAPTLYLVGALDLPPWQRHVLAKRGVTPIDLGPLVPRDRWPQPAARHREALQWFLASLQNGIPADPKDWPHAAPAPNPSSGKGPLPLPPDIVASPAAASEPFALSMTPIQLEALRVSWGEVRRRYPGWITCPEENRKALWQETEMFFPDILQNAATLPPQQSLTLLFELVWRMERIEAPAYDQLPSVVDSALRRVNPFPSLVQIEGAVQPGEGANATIDWEAISSQWLELALFALKAARRSGDTSTFDRYCAWLDPVAQTSPALRAWMSWERCLQHLSFFRIGKFQDELSRWTPTPELPLWELRRASLLAEVGELKEAKDVLSRGLETIRARLAAAFADRELLSLEGWTMAALRAVTLNLGIVPGETPKHANRWKQLARHDASPWDDLRSLEVRLRHSRPSPDIAERRKKFDPGSYATGSS